MKHSVSPRVIGAGTHFFTEFLHLMHLPHDQKSQKAELAHDAHEGDRTQYQNPAPRPFQGKQHLIDPRPRERDVIAARQDFELALVG